MRITNKSGRVGSERCAAAADRHEDRRADRMLPGRRFRTGWARLGALPLVAQLFLAGCTHWVPIEPDFAIGTTRKLDEVRLDGEDGEVVAHPSVTDAELTGLSTSRVTIDLRGMSAADVQLPPQDAAAIAKGQTRYLDEVRVGGELYTNVAITWPELAGVRQRQVTIDLRSRRVVREVTDPIPTGVLITLSVLGGIGLTVGLFYNFASSCPYCFSGL